jgi:hypothetical protein
LVSFTLCLGSGLQAYARSIDVRTSTGAPVAGAIVILASEFQPGPYVTRSADGAGRIEVPDEFDGTLLVLHPSFIPQETGRTAHVTMHPGSAVTLPPPVLNDPGAQVRAYQADWIGRFDVETLPPISLQTPLNCGSPETVFDVTRPGAARTIRLGEISAPRVTSVVSQTIRLASPSLEATSAVAYVAEVAASTSTLHRARILGDGVVTFGDLAEGDQFVLVVFARGTAPFVRSFQARAGAAPIDATASPPARVSARCKCDESRPVRVHTQWTPSNVPKVTIVRRAPWNGDGSIVVDDLGVGTVRVVASAEGLRPTSRDLLLTPDRMSADVGTLCPRPPFHVKGVISERGGRAVRGAKVAYG